MAIYIDAADIPYGRMIMCHMIADSLQELHSMACAIGVRHKWFQEHSSTPHYDICRAKKRLALALGAIEVDRLEFVRIIRRLRLISELCPRK